MTTYISRRNVLASATMFVALATLLGGTVRASEVVGTLNSGASTAISGGGGGSSTVTGTISGGSSGTSISGTVSFWVLPLKPILAVVGTLLGLVLVLYVGVRAYVRRTLIAMGATAGRSDALVARRERALSRVAVLAIFFLIFVLVFLGLLFFLFA